VSPLLLFRRVAIAEAVTWALLLTGMFLKYVTDTTELGVRIFGMAHGIVFIAYCLTTIVVAVDQRWSPGRLLAGLAASVPPFVTIAFDRYAERRGMLATSWRLVAEAPSGPVERPVAWLLRHPVRGAAAGVLGVAALTGVALLVGPPTS
jgi:integral membrane protein